jgi:hypothetical protein
LVLQQINGAENVSFVGWASAHHATGARVWWAEAHPTEATALRRSMVSEGKQDRNLNTKSTKRTKKKAEFQDEPENPLSRLNKG